MEEKLPPPHPAVDMTLSGWTSIATLDLSLSNHEGQVTTHSRVSHGSGLHCHSTQVWPSRLLSQDRRDKNREGACLKMAQQRVAERETGQRLLHLWVQRTVCAMRVCQHVCMDGEGRVLGELD